MLLNCNIYFLTIGVASVGVALILIVCGLMIISDLGKCWRDAKRAYANINSRCILRKTNSVQSCG